MTKMKSVIFEIPTKMHVSKFLKSTQMHGLEQDSKGE